MRFFSLLLLTLMVLSGVVVFAQDEGVSVLSEEDALAELLATLGQGLIVEESTADDGQPCLLVINENTQEVLWRVIYEDTDGNGAFSSGDEIIALINPAGKAIPVTHLVSPLQNRLRERLREQIGTQEENQEGVQNQEKVRNRERFKERVQERVQNEERNEEVQAQEQTQNEEQERERERPKDRLRLKGKR